MRAAALGEGSPLDLRRLRARVLLAGGPYWAFGVSFGLIALGNVLMWRVVRRFVPYAERPAATA